MEREQRWQQAFWGRLVEKEHQRTSQRKKKKRKKRKLPRTSSSRSTPGRARRRRRQWHASGWFSVLAVFPSLVGRPKLPGIIVGMDQKDFLHRARRQLWQWHMLGWFYWYCTSRCVPSCFRQASDARHHGRCEPKGQLCALRSRQWLVQGSFCWWRNSGGHACCAQPQVPVVQTAEKLRIFRSCSSSRTSTIPCSGAEADSHGPCDHRVSPFARRYGGPQGHDGQTCLINILSEPPPQQPLQPLQPPQPLQPLQPPRGGVVDPSSFLLRPLVSGSHLFVLVLPEEYNTWIIWDVTSGYAVFSSTWFDSGYIFLPVYGGPGSRILRSILGLLFVPVYCALVGSTVVTYFASVSGEFHVFSQ